MIDNKEDSISSLFDELDHDQYWKDAGGMPPRPGGSAPMVPPDVNVLSTTDLVHIQNQAMKWQLYANARATRCRYQEKMAEERAGIMKSRLRPNMKGSAADKSDKLRDNMAYMVEYARAEGHKLDKEKFFALESRMKAISELCFRATMARRDTSGPPLP